MSVLWSSWSRKALHAVTALTLLTRVCLTKMPQGQALSFTGLGCGNRGICRLLCQQFWKTGKNIWRKNTGAVIYTVKGSELLWECFLVSTDVFRFIYVKSKTLAGNSLVCFVLHANIATLFRPHLFESTYTDTKSQHIFTQFQYRYLNERMLLFCDLLSVTHCFLSWYILLHCP